MQPSWEKHYAERTQKVTGSIIRELLKLTQQPDIISFAGGLPAPEVFPLQKFQEACNTILGSQGPQSLQYSTTEGHPPFRKMIAEDTAREGIKIPPDLVQITSGSQQALDFVGRMLINRGDKIVVESPTYLGALQAWAVYGAQYLTVPMDEHGMRMDKLEEALKANPKFIYVLPNFQNPSGATLTLERRQELVELADKYGIPIVEDDPYSRLRFEGEHIPSVLALDARYRNQTEDNYNGNVIYMSTFSKLLAPGLRLAWVIAPKEIIQKLIFIKQAADLHTSTFNQMVAYEAARDGYLDKHIEIIRTTYHERRDVMLETMDEVFPTEVKYTRPEGGMFLWASLPEGMDTTEIFKKAVEQKVAFVPGTAFSPDGGEKNSMRINFSFCGPDDIREGITRLGTLLKELVYSK
ncbi:MAG: PLP-dependent aminotransferase family protein [Anaerolineales bacterium]|nr:PLP-dependent aminotransferase family protein [Anaerolineales bacterium]